MFAFETHESSREYKYSSPLFITNRPEQRPSNTFIVVCRGGLLKGKLNMCVFIIPSEPEGLK
jgi:hypothetical protein